MPSKTLKIYVFFLALPILSGVSPAGTPEPSRFRQALPGYTFHFPRDHFSHDDFRIEWWYYTGNLEGENGRGFGYQLTFFRVGLEGKKKIINPSRWKVDRVYFAHMTLSDISGKKFHFFERINRKGLINAGAQSDRLLVWNENWVLARRGRAHRLKAREEGTGIDLQLIPVKNPVIHGQQGISRKGKGAGNASHYFSYTRMKTRGKVFIDGRPFEVRGTSWMDHEFSSNQLSSDLAGWDWFSLKLDNDMEIMLYQLRRKDGGVDPFSSGTLVLADGSSRYLKRRDFSLEATGKWTSEVTGIEYPAGWVVTLPGSKARLTLRPDLADQELSRLRSISGSYWEGSVSIKGTFGGRPVRGKGYVELVGYGKSINRELPE
ncbi:MAG: lipocalin-like domain-containing protein [Nitrospinaceae bacterium]